MSCELRQNGVLYILDLLRDFELESYQKHLQQGCDECERELALLGEMMESWVRADTTVSPDPAVRDKLRERIQQEWRSTDAMRSTQVWKNWNAEDKIGGLLTVHAGQGEWEQLDVDGISIKRLFADPDKKTVTMLVKMATGTAYPSHRHAGAEECYVIEGDLHVGDSTVLRAGDYQRANTESIHVRQWTEHGCLLFIVSSTEDQLLE